MKMARSWTALTLDSPQGSSCWFSSCDINVYFFPLDLRTCEIPFDLVAYLQN